MNEVRIIIIDDHPFTCLQLPEELKAMDPALNVVAIRNSATQGAKAIRELKPDLVFLDVQMPDMDGFAMLDTLPQRDFGLVFITSYDEYAIRAIRYSALDFLLKPIEQEHLRLAFQRFAQARPNIPQRVNNLLALRRDPSNAMDSLVIVTQHGDRQLRTKHIIRCEAGRNYTWFRLVGGQRVLSSYPLANYAEFLEGNEFLRVHRSHMVNVDHVISFSVDGILTLSDGSRVEISRRKKTEVLERLRALPLKAH
ncbi:MAG TPA: LytTR family DNA-binding domain-containing protein [Flavobacteriales bacterium]|nr:LytTR family DNA-binding domain-containing protein [Flavobacteriales bacterium]